MRLELLTLETRDCPAITIRLDYSFDANGFFTAERRAAMQRAAEAVGSGLNDSLAAIVPNASQSRTWTAFAFNAITNSNISISNPTINANELLVYVAGGSIAGSAIGIASSGGYSTGPFPVGSSWPDIIKGRGQPGALNNTDYAPWGGFIAFDSTVNWNFNSAAPAFNQTDFESVAIHELLHVIGYGLDNVPAFTRYISGNSFIGPNAKGSFGGSVPLDPADSGHLAPGVSSGGQTSIMVPSIPAGVERVMTPLDWAILADIGWQIAPVPPPPPPPPPPTGAVGPVRFVVGSGTGRPPLVAGLNLNGGTVWNNAPFASSFTGGVRVASGDFNGDGVLDAVVGTGPGIAAQVRVLNGVNRQPLFEINPFGSFDGGVYVAAGDITGDGRAELLISPDRGGGPRVRIFNGNGFGQISDWFGIDDVNFRGGARVAVGDLNNDGRGDVIVSAGFGGGPRVALFDGKQLTMNGGPKFRGDFFAFESNLRNGAFVAAGDVNGDGFTDLIAGGGPGGGPRTTVFSGKALLNNQFTRLADFFAESTASRAGIHLASFDRDGDGEDDILAGSGTGFGSTIRLFDDDTLTAANPSPAFSINYFNDTGGIFVG